MACLSPIQIGFKYESVQRPFRVFKDVALFDKSTHQYRARRLVGSCVSGDTKGSMLVPCGKCSACLRRKQNDYVVALYRTAQKMGNVHFLTLTYDNEHVPLFVTDLVYGDDGAVIERSAPRRFTGISERILRREYFSGRL